ncbi:unnamed protein product, partial [Allacma fusca]
IAKTKDSGLSLCPSLRCDCVGLIHPFCPYFIPEYINPWKDTTVINPIKIQLNELISHVDALRHSVDSYVGPHITQDFRNINATLEQLEIKFDKVPIPSDDSLNRNLRKQGLRALNEALLAFYDAIYANEANGCSQCLPLGGPAPSNLSHHAPTINTPPSPTSDPQPTDQDALDEALVTNITNILDSPDSVKSRSPGLDTVDDSLDEQTTIVTTPEESLHDAPADSSEPLFSSSHDITPDNVFLSPEEMRIPHPTST